MRNPLNNPTERMGRLIEEFDELLALADVLYTVLDRNVNMDIMRKLPPMPRFPNLEAERTRRSLTYSRSTLKNRQRKALDAVRTDKGATLRQAVRRSIHDNPSLDKPFPGKPVVGDTFKKPDKLDI